MSQDISKFVRHPKKCHKMRDAKTQKTKVPLKIWKTPTHRNMKIRMDLVDPLTPSREHKYILTIMDAFTRYTELVAIPDKKSTTVTKELLDQWILRHGFYERVISPISPHINGQV